MTWCSTTSRHAARRTELKLGRGQQDPLAISPLVFILALEIALPLGMRRALITPPAVMAPSNSLQISTVRQCLPPVLAMQPALHALASTRQSAVCIRVCIAMQAATYTNAGHAPEVLTGRHPANQASPRYQSFIVDLHGCAGVLSMYACEAASYTQSKSNVAHGPTLAGTFT